MITTLIARPLAGSLAGLTASSLERIGLSSLVAACDPVLEEVKGEGGVEGEEEAEEEGDREG